MKMRKNIMKKIAAVVSTAVLSVCSIVAMPTEAKAATTTELYLETDTDAEYSLGFWQGTSGIQIDAEVTADGWTYAFEKVEDGLYKINLLLSETFSGAGLSISVNGVETYKSDPNWSGVAGAEAWIEFTEALGASDIVRIGLDATNVTITVKSSEGGNEGSEETEAPQDETEAPQDETEAPEETEAPQDETKATSGGNVITTAATTAASSSNSSNTSNTSAIVIGVSVAVIVIVAVIVVIVVAASKKKTVDDDDDFEY